MVDNGDELEAEQTQMEKLLCHTECDLCGDTLWSWADYKSIKDLEVKLSVLFSPAGNFDSIIHHEFWISGLMFSHSNLTVFNR